MTVDSIKPTDKRIQCPIFSPVRSLCLSVSQQSDGDPPDQYLYESMIKRAAGVEGSDPKEVEAAKVRKMWSAFQALLYCDSSEFDIPNGSVIKFAIVTQFDAFLSELVEYLKVDLNYVDPADGRTALDYIAHRLVQERGTANEVKLPRYQREFRKAGAKYRSELKN